MISVRRLILSFLAASLILMVGVSSASADPTSALERAKAGVTRGLEAVSEVVDVQAGTVVADSGLQRATAAYEAWAREQVGWADNPGNAATVHEQLMSGEIPGRLKAQSRLSSIAGAFETLKAQADTAKQGKAKGPRENGPKDEKPDPPDQAKNG